ncbi:unnamed protein product [Rotaria sp. Silwood1]|nr:unnamed protein product [Rotaria sp. Silwood1]CAF3696496.1 unnamed protein product [Rotaria sp. Silwood1]
MTTTTEFSLTTSSKRRQIMIITGDEDVLKQIRISSTTSEVEPILVEFSNATQDTSHLTVVEMQALVKRKKSNSRTLTCVVCGGIAHGYNFDAITCASCKAFFRRNAHKDPEKLKCESNQNCKISFASERRCSACRLIKCLNSGMRRDRLLTDEQRAAKRRKIEENRQVTLNLHSNKSVPPVGTVFVHNSKYDC